MRSFKEWQNLNERNDAYQIIDRHINGLLGQTAPGSEEEKRAYGGAVGTLTGQMSELLYEFIEAKTLLQKLEMQNNPEISQTIASMEQMIKKFESGS